MEEATNDEILRDHLRRVVRDFFKDKPPGTTIEPHDLDAYHRRLRKVVEEHRRCRDAGNP